jgi:hypothetical protein
VAHRMKLTTQTLCDEGYLAFNPCKECTEAHTPKHTHRLKTRSQTFLKSFSPQRRTHASTCTGTPASTPPLSCPRARPPAAAYPSPLPFIPSGPDRLGGSSLPFTPILHARSALSLRRASCSAVNIHSTSGSFLVEIHTHAPIHQPLHRRRRQRAQYTPTARPGRPPCTAHGRLAHGS